LAQEVKAGRIAEAVSTAVRLLAHDPLQEAVHRTLMRLLADRGRRDAALRQYQVCVDTLARELSVEPEPATRQLYQQILRMRQLTPSPAPEAEYRSVIHPSGDTVLVGRAREVDRLRTALDALEQGRGGCLALFGEAGIGKSRLAGEAMAEALKRGAHALVG